MTAKRFRRLLLALVTILPAGCGGAFDIYSPDQIHRTVRPRAPGLYVVYYEWPFVRENYGKDRAMAVPAYLKAKGLIPPECTQGVAVIRGNDGEGGKAWAEFRCK
jgi:hypothetical protein